jgi:PAS domain S-box-containing protein
VPRLSRPAGPTRLAPVVLVVVLGVASYLVTSRSVRRDQDADTARRAQLEGVRARAVLNGARASVEVLGNALAGEPVPASRRFAQLHRIAAGSVRLTDALWLERVRASRRASYERRLGAPITRFTPSGGYRRAPPAASYLPVTFVLGTQPEIRRGVDLSSVPALHAALRDRTSRSAVAATLPTSLAGRPGLFLLRSGRFGRGPDSRGVLAMFVPRGWLTRNLATDPRRVAVTVDGRPLEGSASGASDAFDALARHWRIAVEPEPLTGLRATLPWFALAWPIAAAALGYALLYGRLRRRRAEREREQIFDLSLDLLGIATVDGRFVRVNPAFERTLGYSSEVLVSRPLAEFVHPDDRAATQDVLDQLARGDAIVRFENRCLRADGSVCWLQWSARPADGLVYAAARDVTESRHAEEELRHAQRMVVASRDELRAVADGQAALRRIATLVARGAPPEDVFAAVATEVHSLLAPDFTTLQRLDPDGTWTVLAVRGSLRGDDTWAGFRWHAGPNPGAGDVRGGRVARVDDLGGLSGTLAEVVAMERLRSWVAAPISVDAQPRGVLVVASRHGPLPAATEERLAEFADIVATAIANAESRAELAVSRARVVAAADETRRRIERDLHDGTQQRLISLALSLRATESKLPADQSGIRDELARTADGLIGAVEDLREISRGIHPAILTRGGLGPALKALARRAAIPVELDVRAQPQLSEPAQVAVYYVVSEALTNAEKHASASCVWVELDTDGQSVRVAVRDDGAGGADADRGSGLTGLRDRVEALGGTIEISSPPGLGTSLVASIPVEGPVPPPRAVS